jgi:TPR repeat protein
MQPLALVLALLAAAGCVAADRNRSLMADDFLLGKNAYEHKNYVKAYQWLKPAAEAGNPNAQFYLGMMYDFGYVLINDKSPHIRSRPLSSRTRTPLQLKSDREQAVAWYLKAAEQGQDDAQFNLAISYSTGEGIEQDDDKAIYWLDKSAASGDQDALNRLKGYADDGYADAQYALARLYREGARLHHDLRLYPSEDDNQEIIPNPAIARRWLQEAAANGQPQAIKELQR